MTFSQDNRPLRVTTDLASDVLLLRGFSGTESVSAPFMYQVDMASERTDIDTKALLRRPIQLSIRLEDDSERHIHGMISRVVEHGHENGMSMYRAEMVPQLWFLGLNRDARIFQQKDVLQIVEEVLGDGGVEFDFRCTGTYPTIEYCVQYRESDLAFVQRLLEQEGIFYFFEHEDGKHTMVIADDKAAFVMTPHRSDIRYRSEGNVDEDVITRFDREHSVHVGTVTLRDYDPLQPLADMSASISGEEEQEFYDYPGSYAKLFCNDVGDVATQADRYARLRLELEESRHHTTFGEGNCRGILAGCQFTLEEHYREDMNRDYVITSLSQVAYNGNFMAGGGGGAASYSCTFTAIDSDTQFRPERRTPRPIVEGTQTARVVGPSGEEIWTDNHGRVKCQFHWDRVGQFDENSSRWVRCATDWAGKGYGSVSIPRIDSEVVVDFLEGDPDQPLIVGCVYNDDQVPPNPLPDSGIQQGIKSRSSKGGGGYNEISVTDTKGEEAITIHGQYDMNTTVQNDLTEVVNNNRTTTIAVDDSQTIGSNQTNDVAANRTTSVGGDETVTVGGNQSTDVGADLTLTVGGSQTITVAADETYTIEAARETNTGADDTLNVGANYTVDTAANTEHKTGANYVIDAGAQVEIKAGATIKLSAGAMIELEAGGSSIQISPGGIMLKTGAIIGVTGSMVKIN